jgi:hypothetical protein
MPGERHRDQRLTVGLLAEHRRILRRDADRLLALFRQRRVVNDEHRIGAADQSIRLYEKLPFERGLVPEAGTNEVMKLIVIGPRTPRGHRLHAFALARTDQTRNIERTHPTPRFVAQVAQKRPEPASKVILPVWSRGHRCVLPDEASDPKRYHSVNLPK